MPIQERSFDEVTRVVREGGMTRGWVVLAILAISSPALDTLHPMFLFNEDTLS